LTEIQSIPVVPVVPADETWLHAIQAAQSNWE
jgi:hypothetical protein